METTVSPFVASPEPPAVPWYTKVLRRALPDRAAMALRQLLAQSEPKEIHPRQVGDVLSANHLSGKAAHGLLVALYQDALTAFIADDVLTDEEVGYLLDLRKLFDLGEDDVQAVEQAVVHPRLNRAIAEVLADHRVDASERDMLAKLGHDLRVSPVMQRTLFQRSATALMQSAVHEALSDQRLTPDEMEELAALSYSTGMPMPSDDDTVAALHRAALLWRVENGDLPQVPVGLNLQKGEECSFTAPVSWYEYRKTTRTEGYSSQGMSFRIARGVYYRVGGSRPVRVTTEGLTLIDQGTIYFTNKRVIFVGFRKNVSIRLSAILGLQVFADGLAIEKGSGASPHLVVSGDAELGAMILSRLLAKG